MTIYNVIHYYGVDGGFGDYVAQTQLLGCFESEEDAKTFIDRFSKPHIYDVPYAELDCGKLGIVPVNVIEHNKFDINDVDTSNFWWLTNEVIEETSNWDDIDSLSLLHDAI